MDNLKSKSWYKKKLSDLTEDEFIEFYDSISNDLKPFLLMTDCKQLTYAVNKILDKRIPNKITWWKFWKMYKKCPYCDNEMIDGRTIHCGQSECWLKYKQQNLREDAQ